MKAGSGAQYVGRKRQLPGRGERIWAPKALSCRVPGNQSRFAGRSKSLSCRGGGRQPCAWGTDSAGHCPTDIQGARRPVSRVLFRARLRWIGPFDDHSSGTSVAGRLARPTRAAARKLRWAEALPPLFGLAPGGVYRAAPVAGGAVRSYRTLSPLPGPRARRFAFCGTFPGVAPARRYLAPCFRGARTFLPPSHKGAGSSRPAVWRIESSVRRRRTQRLWRGRAAR